ncbi:MAG: RICIN domain-containing protein [Streptosporangiales bacterium]|nr:RICIN domain-containing protein [Streptosporangiales bacterium]
MRKIRHIAAMAAGTGLLALGGVGAVGTGHANASTNTHVSGCSDSATGLTAGVQPKCSSSGTVRYPTQIKLTVNSDQLSALLNPVTGGVGQGIKDSWSLACYAGSTRILNESGTFKVTSSQTKTSTTLPLRGQTPSSCSVKSTVSTLLGLSETLIGSIQALGVSDSVTADTGTLGAVRNATTWCADSMGNAGVPGTKVAAWKCLSDLSQRWIHAPNGELVHEGRCLGYTGTGAVDQQACTGAADQIWSIAGAGRELHSKGGRCLAVGKYRDGTQLWANPCRWGVWQRWTIVPRSKY